MLKTYKVVWWNQGLINWHQNVFIYIIVGYIFNDKVICMREFTKKKSNMYESSPKKIK